MGLFDNIFGDKSANRGEITRQQAFAGILLAASACDGHIADEEVASLFNTITRMKMFENMNEKKWTNLMDSLIKMLRREGAPGLVEICAPALPKDLRDCAFANACDIVLADGVVEPEERAFLEHLQKEMELDGDTALSIVEVMIVKNKG